MLTDNRGLYYPLAALIVAGLVALVAGAHALIPWLCAAGFAWFGVWCAGALAEQARRNRAARLPLREPLAE